MSTAYLKKMMMLMIVLASMDCGQTQQSNGDIENIESLLQEKKWKEAELLLAAHLDNQPDSKYREKWYDDLLFVFWQQYYDQQLSHALRNTPKTDEMPRGSVKTVLSEDLGDDAKIVLFKIIDIGNRYLNEFSLGEHCIAFQNSRLAAYRLLGLKSRATRIARSLFSSEKFGLRLKGAWTLAMYAQAEQQFEEAIDYHEFIVKNETDLVEKIRHTYYIAVCHYELGRLKDAKDYLSEVFEMSQETSNKNFDKLARIMWEYLEDYEKNKDEPKRHFVFFEGIDKK